MKMLNASWMSAIAQPCVLFIGWTNSVQLYWRLAIIIMQTTPKASCAQRLTGGATLCAADMVVLPSAPCRPHARRQYRSEGGYDRQVVPFPATRRKGRPRGI